ncbi:MAG: TIM barrel protein, partial [Planctomycetales bacterium]|nr:TIM barrel protein [Planctomycetales bacterium]
MRKALQSAARLGAQGVEIDARGELRPAEMTGTAVRQFRKLLEDMNLRVASVCFMTRRGYADEAELDRRVAATKEAMRMAYELRCPTVVNHLGRLPSSDDDPRWKLL